MHELRIGDLVCFKKTAIDLKEKFYYTHNATGEYCMHLKTSVISVVVIGQIDTELVLCIITHNDGKINFARLHHEGLDKL